MRDDVEGEAVLELLERLEDSRGNPGTVTIGLIDDVASDELDVMESTLLEALTDGTAKDEFDGKTALLAKSTISLALKCLLISRRDDTKKIIDDR